MIIASLGYTIYVISGVVKLNRFRFKHFHSWYKNQCTTIAKWYIRIKILKDKETKTYHRIHIVTTLNIIVQHVQCLCSAICYLIQSNPKVQADVAFNYRQRDNAPRTIWMVITLLNVYRFAFISAHTFSRNFRLILVFS